MTLTDKLLKISELIHSDGGLGFIKIRLLMEDIDAKIHEGNPLALKFEESLDNVLKAVTYATNQKLG